MHKSRGGKEYWKTDSCETVSASLRMFVNGGSGDIIDDVSYMVEEMTGKYFKRFFKHLVYMYKTVYFTRWQTVEEL